MEPKVGEYYISELLSQSTHEVVEINVVKVTKIMPNSDVHYKYIESFIRNWELNIIPSKRFLQVYKLCPKRNSKLWKALNE